MKGVGNELFLRKTKLSKLCTFCKNNGKVFHVPAFYTGSSEGDSKTYDENIALQNLLEP